MPRDALQKVTEEIITRFDGISVVRDRALSEGRQVVRLSANSVRAVHRNDFAEAKALLADAQRMIQALTAALTDHPSIYWAGYVQDAMKEYAEAQITYAVVNHADIPGPADLGVEDAPYLNALAESASELRRDVLDRLRADDLARGEDLLAQMDAIYDVLITVDFPDAITGGLRRTTDQLRAVLERTRADLTIAITQKRLQQSLHEAREALGETRIDVNFGDDSAETTHPSES